MSRAEPYDDPILATRTRAWMHGSAPTAAPERLVFSVMDEVGRWPRRQRRRISGLPILSGFARYAALTLVIAIGVAAGIVISRTVENVGVPTAPPTPTPSLRFLGDAATDGLLLASDTNSAWLVTRGGNLVPIQAGGTHGEPTSITFVPSDIAALTDSSHAYGGPETVWLVAPGSDLLRLDPSVGEFVVTRGVTGSRLAIGAGAAWVSQAGKVEKVAADVMTASGAFDVPGHRATDPMLVVGDALWVGTDSQVERLDVSTGARTARSRVVASSLVLSRGLIWAAEGSRLLGIDPSTGDTTLSVSPVVGASDIVSIATRGDTVWLATGPGPSGPLLIGIDPATGHTTSLTPLQALAISIAVVGDQVWTLDAGGRVRRFGPG